MDAAKKREPILRILFDVNVLLDVILDREPHVRAAALLLAAAETGRIRGLISAITVPTVFYVVRRSRTRLEALSGIRRLMEILEVAPVTGAVLEDALRLGFTDYEDAIQHEAARYAQADGIVTRNVSDFKSASIAVYSPEQLTHVVSQD